MMFICEMHASCDRLNEDLVSPLMKWWIIHMTAYLIQTIINEDREQICFMNAQL